MTGSGLRCVTRLLLLGVVIGAGSLASTPCQADQVEMVNGERYIGRVLSLGPDTLVVQSEVLGTLKIPRRQIATITLSSAPASIAQGTNAFRTILVRSNATGRVTLAARTNASPELAAAMRQLGNSSNMVQQVQQQLLTGAGPEAQAKFNDLLEGLLSGKLNLDDLRAEAKSTLSQVRSARKDLGEDNGSMLDSYLAILDSFVKETEPLVASTNLPVKPAPPATPPAPDSE